MRDQRNQRNQRNQSGLGDHIKMVLDRYLLKIHKAYQTLESEKIGQLIELLEIARDQEKSIYICGNGGSSANASHLICDFNKGVAHGCEAAKGGSTAATKRFRCFNLSDNRLSIGGTGINQLFHTRF